MKRPLHIFMCSPLGTSGYASAWSPTREGRRNRVSSSEAYRGPRVSAQTYKRSLHGESNAEDDDPEYWNSKVRAPHCFNPAAARTFLPIYLKKTRLVLTGKSKAQILAATTSAFEDKELPALAPGAMVYMMSKRQYLSDRDMGWRPHLMFYVSGDAAKSWGANLTGSPVIAANDPEERVTIFMVVAGAWSDGTPGPSMTH